MAKFHSQTIGLLLFIIGFVGVFSITNIYAHAPSSLSLGYDMEKQELTVNITHSVSNPATHYINEVEIKVNNVVVNTSTYTSQPTGGVFSYVYQINATAGDTISVTAKCNQGGSNIDSITLQSVSQTPTDSTSGTSTTPDNDKIPGFELFIPFIVFGITIGIIFARNRVKYHLNS